MTTGEPRTFEDTPAGVAAALDDWKRSVPWLERWRINKARPEAELRAAFTWFRDGVIPPQLLAWFSWWDGQSERGCWLPGVGIHALSLQGALQARQNLLGFGEDWSALSKFPDWVPLIQSAGGDIALFVETDAGSGLCLINHENPLEVLDEWGPELDCTSLVDSIAEAAFHWRSR